MEPPTLKCFYSAACPPTFRWIFDLLLFSGSRIFFFTQRRLKITWTLSSFSSRSLWSLILNSTQRRASFFRDAFAGVIVYHRPKAVAPISDESMASASCSSREFPPVKSSSSARSSGCDAPSLLFRSSFVHSRIFSRSCTPPPESEVDKPQQRIFLSFLARDKAEKDTFDHFKATLGNQATLSHHDVSKCLCIYTYAFDPFALALSGELPSKTYLCRMSTNVISVYAFSPVTSLTFNLDGLR